MKTKIFTLLLAIVAGVISISGAEIEYDFVENGIYYKKLTESTVAVHYKNYSKSKGYNIAYGSPNTITAAIIPAVVQYSGVQYDVVAISSHAFENCSGLASITCRSTTPPTVGSDAFKGVSTSIPIYVPEESLDTYKSANGWSIFTNIFFLSTDINIIAAGSCGQALTWQINVNGILTISGTGTMDDYDNTNQSPWSSYRANINSIVIEDSVTSIGTYAFMGCRGLTSVTIGNNVTSIGDYAFYGCSSLTSVTIPNSVTSIGTRAFYGCSGLTSVTIPSSVTSIGGYAFGECTGLTSVTIPNSVTSIGEKAFYYCTGLTSVTIGNNVTSIGEWAFGGCSGLTKVNIMDIAAWCNIAFSNYGNPLSYAQHLYVNDVEVTDLVIPNSVTFISGRAFSGCSGLTTVTIPNSVTNIGKEAFDGCTGLTSVTIPNSVTSIGEKAFYYCTGLTSVTIGNNVTSIGKQAFYCCTNLHSVVWNAKNCPNFAPNNTPFYANYYIDGYDHIYFDLRPQITSFTFGSDVEHIPANLLEGMRNLPFINLSNTIAWAEQNFSKTNSTLNSMTLYLNGQEIKKLTISDGVTSIGAYTFINCAKMTELTIPSSVTTIGEGAFMNENRLQKITLGENIETIANSAFANCPYLLEIHARMEFPPVIDASVFADCGDLSGIDCYVPEDSYAFYKKTAVWKEFNLIAEQEPEPTAINPVSDDKPAQMNKILRNGQIFILRGDKTYSITGQEVK